MSIRGLRSAVRETVVGAHSDLRVADESDLFPSRPSTHVEIYGPRVARRRIATWGGSGGSTVFNHLDARMTVAYVMNQHLEHGGLDERGIAIVRAAYAGLAER